MNNQYVNRPLSAIVAPIVAQNAVLAKQALAQAAKPKRTYNNLPSFGTAADGVCYVGKQDCN
jgi:hypothetical protein